VHAPLPKFAVSSGGGRALLPIFYSPSSSALGKHRVDLTSLLNRKIAQEALDGFHDQSPLGLAPEEAENQQFVARDRRQPYAYLGVVFDASSGFAGWGPAHPLARRTFQLGHG
jgi:hypothetical protein